MTEEKKAPETAEPKKPKTIADLFPSDDDEEGESTLLAKLIGEDGKLKVDTETPPKFEIDIMASMMVDQLVSFKQTQKSWRSARNLGDNAHAKQLFEQWRFNQLTIALIQADFPKAKELANQMMNLRADNAEKQRESALTQEE